MKSAMPAQPDPGLSHEAHPNANGEVSAADSYGEVVRQLRRTRDPSAPSQALREGCGNVMNGNRMTLIEELTAWASTLQLDAVPDRVVRYAKSQLLSQLAAA